jgi:hypothetical protein
MQYSAYFHVLTGRTVPLTPHPNTLAVWQTRLPPDILDPAHPDSPPCGPASRGGRAERVWGGQRLE